MTITYDLINPTADCTFEAPDLQIAALAVLILSNGFYGATPVAPEMSHERVPIFLTGGALAWWNETFPETMQDVIDARHLELITALESVTERIEMEKGVYVTYLPEATAECDFPVVETYSDVERMEPGDIAYLSRQYAKSVRDKYSVTQDGR